MLCDFWTARARKKLKSKKIPQHIAVIMDGNGRWAKRRGLPRIKGHAQGAETLSKVIEEAAYLGVKYLSVYAFSTENWKRPQEEIDGLMNLFMEALTVRIGQLKDNKIKVCFLGELSKFSREIQANIKKAEKETDFKDNNLILNVKLNYGSRNEIVNAVNRIIKDNKKNIDEKVFSEYLYTKNIPDPDLLIRTSGELRISNFMLWQMAYSEFWFTKKYWPDFNARLLRRAVAAYQKRKIRKGGL